MNLSPKRFSFECSKQPRLHTHSRWAFKSGQTVEVFRKAERATLKECVTFSLRRFFFPCMRLKSEVERSLDESTTGIWHFSFFQFGHCKTLTENVWRMGWDSGRMPGDVNPRPGSGKTSLGGFLDGVQLLFRPQSLLNHLTSVLHSLYPSLSLSLPPHPEATQYN